MRLLEGRGWLAVAALALRTVAGDHVTFTSGFEGPPEYPGKAIILSAEATIRKFTWTSDADVEEIQLYNWDSISNMSGLISSWTSASAPQGATPSSTGPLNGAHTSNPVDSSISEGDGGDDFGWGGRHHGRAAQAGGDHMSSAGSSTMPFEVETYQGGGGAVRFTSIGSENIGSPLYFEVKWTGGVSYSRNFVIVDSAAEFDGQSRTGLFDENRPHQPELIISPTTSLTPSSTGKSSNGDIVVSNNGNSKESSDSGGGLSGGAVIGIAVACGVVGLALVFGLVWFLLRRRQQKKAMLPVNSYSSANRGEELMAEKEASADVSPHSPYSDDGGPGGIGAAGRGSTYQDSIGHATEGAAAVAGSSAAAAAAHPRSYTPYSDRPSGSIPGGGAGTPSVRAASVAQTDDQSAAVHVSIPSATPGRATPRALTTPYAHLVEEGMTEEEIRRLEEEERQLDAAIEQRQGRH